jgi:hypothetical protein
MDSDFRTRRFVCPHCLTVELDNFSDLQWHVAQVHTTYDEGSPPPKETLEWGGTAFLRARPQLDELLRDP